MSTKKKIIIATIMRDESGVGLQTHINYFKKYLRGEEIDFFVATPFSYHKWILVPVFGIRKVIDILSGELSVWWYRHWHYLFLKKFLTGYLAYHARKGMPVIIYAQCPLSAKAALEARHSPGQKVVMTVHFNISQAEEWADKGKISKAGKVYKKIRSLEAVILPQLDGIVYVSNFIKEAVEKDVPGVAAVRSSVIPNFIEMPPRVGPIKMKNDLISIGSLEPRKNQAFLLYVLAEAKKRGRSYSLTLIGDGDCRGDLISMAKSLGLHKQVNFLGFKKNAEQFLSGHKIYCHSAKMESFGIAIVEAMAYGLPVLAGGTGGITEIFSSGIEGFYWPLDNPSTAAGILIRLMEDEDLREQMGRAAYMRFSRNFSTELLAERLLRFIYDT